MLVTTQIWKARDLEKLVTKLEAIEPQINTNIESLLLVFFICFY